MSPTRRNVLVGAVVLGSVVVLAFMILKFANKGADYLFANGTKIRIIADQASGVGEGAAVTYLGVDVGHVMSVQLSDDTKRVIIDAQLEKNKKIPANVRGSIHSTSALGGTSAIALEPVGTPSTQLLKGGEELQAISSGGGLVPQEFTALAQDARQREVIRHMDEMVVSIRDQSAKLGKLIDSTDSLLNDKTMREDIRVSLKNIRTVSAQANDIGTDVQKFTASLDGTSRHLNERIDEMGKTLQNLQVATDNIREGKGTLGMLVNDPRLYESLHDTAGELKITIATLKRLVEQWEQEGISLKLK